IACLTGVDDLTCLVYVDQRRVGGGQFTVLALVDRGLHHLIGWFTAFSSFRALRCLPALSETLQIPFDRSCRLCSCLSPQTGSQMDSWPTPLWIIGHRHRGRGHQSLPGAEPE